MEARLICCKVVGFLTLGEKCKVHMRVRDGHNAHGAVKNCIKAILLAALPFMGVVVSDMLPGPPLAVAVRNPAEFQEAVRGGVRHVVITEHLDMTTTPRSPNATILDAGIIAVVANEFGRHTATIRVRRCLSMRAAGIMHSNCTRLARSVFVFTSTRKSRHDRN